MHSVIYVGTRVDLFHWGVPVLFICLASFPVTATGFQNKSRNVQKLKKFLIWKSCLSPCQNISTVAQCLDLDDHNQSELLHCEQFQLVCQSPHKPRPKFGVGFMLQIFLCVLTGCTLLLLQTFMLKCPTWMLNSNMNNRDIRPPLLPGCSSTLKFHINSRPPSTITADPVLCMHVMPFLLPQPEEIGSLGHSAYLPAPAFLMNDAVT